MYLNMRVFLAKESHAILTRAVFLGLTAFFVFFAMSGTAQAAARKGFEALQVSAPKQGFTIEPGATKTVTINFQNIGTTTWKNSGKAFVSAYTQRPKYRTSNFRADVWKDYTQTTVLKEASVAPGKTGTIELALKAPMTEGEYQETFQLASENTTWIPGGEFTLVIQVKNPQSSILSFQPSHDGVASPVSASGLSAALLIRSSKEVVAEAGQEISYRVGVKNTGTVAWKTREIRSADLAIASVNTQHSSWISSTKLVMKEGDEVKPGALDLIEFIFVAPPTKGKHVVSYRLAVNDTVVPDFSIDIPVEVTNGAQEALESPVITSALAADVMIPEPTVRIGVLIVDEETDWQVEISCDSEWNLMDGEGGLLGEMRIGEMARAFYKNQRYYFNRGKGIEQTEKYLRFVPKNKDGVCTIQNFDRRRTRGAGFADNQFRDVLELRYNSAKNRTWMINELPVEEYLYGLAETSDASHQEFKKALVTVARTYGVYHYERATKHAKEFFHMNSTADDQVYKGYGYEARNPLIRQAVEETRGVISTYQNATALTPYFSRSDGRTRDWSEVWGGSVVWVKSVPAPCDARKGRTLWGHGVGMSATEALCMAEENGKTWQEILEYFFQGIELKKKWRL
jgi:hypothetical protein